MPFIIFYMLSTIKRWYIQFEDWMLYTWGDFFSPLQFVSEPSHLRYALALSKPIDTWQPDTYCDIPTLWIKIYDE